MKQGLFFAALMLLMGAQTAVDAQGLAVSDVQNSGCLRSTRTQVNENEQRQTIILTKEGDILSVQLLGFRANCCISGFDVKSNIKDGSETMPCLLSVSVGSYSDEEEECDCICPYNISFTINGVEVNSFRFSCWWYDGLVSLTEGEPLALEDIKEDVSIDGTIYTLDKVAHTAKLIRKNAGESEVNIPSELSYEGQEYTVNSIGSYVFHSNAALTSVTIPSSISYIGDATFYGCSNLKEFCCQADDVPVTGSWVFDNTPIASATLHVPAGSIEEYKATSPWSGFSNIVALPEEPHKPLPFLEGNPIWVFKYEHTPRLRDPRINCWIDTGVRVYTYFFLGGRKEIEGRDYTMMGKVTSVTSNGEDIITFNCWLPVREENGIIYTLTDSLLEVCEREYGSPGPDYEPYKKDDLPYLQQGNECVLYNFCTEIGETLYPQDDWSIVNSIVTCQLMDGTICRALKTRWGYELCEKLGYLNIDLALGIMVPILGMIVSTNGDVYVNLLNAYYQDDTMLYKAPDAPEGLCVNDTCWTRDDAYNYAMSYKANPYHEEVMSYIRQLQKAEEPVTFTKDQMATIILPSAPDASKGKYYRLDRCEDGQIVFEQELQPRAHVPYIIMPDEDFSIDPRAFDLSGLNSDTVSIDGISFIGSYVRKALPQRGSGEGAESFYIDIIDTTPDCSLSPSEGTGKAAVIGALRAYLLVDWVKLNWNDPYDQGGTKGPWEGMPIVLHDDGNGMIEIDNGKFNNQNEGEVANGKWSNGKCYDLSGRKIVNRKSSNSKSHRVIYIVDGKKTVK